MFSRQQPMETYSNAGLSRGRKFLHYDSYQIGMAIHMAFLFLLVPSAVERMSKMLMTVVEANFAFCE